MEQVNHISKGSSIRTSFITYIMVCLLVACMISFISTIYCQYQQYQVYLKYQDMIMSDSEELTNRATLFYHDDISAYYSESDKRLVEDWRIASLMLIPIWFTTCIIVTSFLFYNKKMKKPLEVLDAATEKISDNNLDFTVSYESSNEFGRLCDSFEKMRISLKESNQELWRQMDEHKRLNAAFSHDLRTPLTVLKGQSDMLIKYVPEGKVSTDKLISTLTTMQSNIIRLENYVQTMNRMQKLEDIEVKKESVSKSQLIDVLRESAEIVCSDKKLNFDTQRLTDENILLDLSIVEQVYENLISNAVRYANSVVMVHLSSSPFEIVVEDDGKGFSSQDLKKATDPFYRSERQGDDQHFGVGLNICQILCIKHGGSLFLSNGKSGAIVKAIF